MKRFVTALMLVAIPLAVAACGSNVKKEAKYPTGADRGAVGQDVYAEPDSIFGKGGLSILGGDKSKERGGSSIGVNSYLWRASLDTISFMPLASADPFGGVILTEWYSPPENPDSRYKLNVFILSRQLRSDGIEVKVFRQERKSGNWQDVESSGETARKLEDTILTRARQMRVAQRQAE